MGIRMDQVVGLNDRALAFIAGEPVLVCMERVTRVFPDNREETLPPRPVFEPSIKKEESGLSFSGMFDTEYPLHKYTFPNGRVLFEKEQASPWSSGPVIFLALVDENGDWVPESRWTDKEIEENT